jgi:O-antigen ligase
MFFLLGKSTVLIKTVTFIILLILITTLSRFAWLGFTLSFIYGIIISMKYGYRRFDLLKDRLLILFSVCLLGLGVMFATGLQNLFIERFSDLDFSELLTQNEEKELIENSLETRILIWIVALNAFLQNMWTGLGYQMFFVVSENYNFLPDVFYDNIVKERDAHTTYLNFLVDNGIIGLISYLAFSMNVFWLSFKSIKMAANFDELKISIVLNTLVFFILVHSIYSGAFTFGQNAFNMYFIFALVVANYVILKKDSMKKVN